MPIPFLKSLRPAKAARNDDPLAFFEAESSFSMHDEAETADAGLSVDMSAPVAPGDASVRSVTLQTVLSQHTPVYWSEAVAIVDGVCTALLQEDGTERTVPDISDIVLTPDGAIEVHGGGRRADSVQRLGRMLHALTSEQAVPAPLRLFVTKWIAWDGQHSIAEFAKELAYFARPDGKALVREVHQRCISGVVGPKKAPVPEPVKGKTKKKKPQEQRTQVSPRARRLVVLTGVIAACAVLMAAVLLVRPQSGAETSRLLETLLARASEFAASLGEMRNQVGNIREELNAHLTGGETGTPAQAAAGPAAPAGRGRGTTVRSAQGGVAAARTAASPAPAPAAIATAVIPAVPAEAAPAETAITEPVAETPVPAAPPAIPPDAIFSIADPSVSPPKMVYPQLPPPPLVLGANPNGINVMEVVVGNTGAVERVKLVSQPRRMTDMMLLSGAKMWRFAPASKDGQPVRYRIAVSWATTP